MNGKQKIFTQIAQKHLGIQTLEQRNRDSLDFHDVGVVGVQQALSAAYDAGQASAGAGLTESLRDNLSPEAVAAMVSWLQPATTNDKKVTREIAWFRDQLVDMLGGGEQQSSLAEELGL